MLKSEIKLKKKKADAKYWVEKGYLQNLKSHFGVNGLKVLEKYGYKCAVCGMTNEEHIKKYKKRISIDHIDGVGRYSPNPNNSIENLQVLCLSCHGKKDFRWGCQEPCCVKKRLSEKCNADNLKLVNQ